MNQFVMTVSDVFHFEDGRTIFVGPVESQEGNIRPCECEVIVNGEIKGTLKIDGEEIPKGKKTADRAISTSQRIDLATYGVGRGQFLIRSKI
jgi:hypothetical protein